MRSCVYLQHVILTASVCVVTGSSDSVGHQRQHASVQPVTVCGGREWSGWCRHRDTVTECCRPWRGSTSLLYDPLRHFAGEQQQVQDQFCLWYVTFVYRYIAVFWITGLTAHTAREFQKNCHQISPDYQCQPGHKVCCESSSLRNWSMHAWVIAI